MGFVCRSCAFTSFVSSVSLVCVGRYFCMLRFRSFVISLLISFVLDVRISSSSLYLVFMYLVVSFVLSLFRSLFM